MYMAQYELCSGHSLDCMHAGAVGEHTVPDAVGCVCRHAWVLQRLRATAARQHEHSDSCADQHSSRLQGWYTTTASDVSSGAHCHL